MQAATRPEIIEILTDVFREVFDTPSLTLRDDMTAADVENWDSLNHIDMIVAIERRLKIRFTTREVGALRNVGNLIDLIQEKLRARS
jgi:acyl carrier protein